VTHSSESQEQFVGKYGERNIMASSRSAPSFRIPPREIVAVEHPMIIKNIDNGLKTFGTGVPLVQVSEF
jgi:hypothetical protein